MAEWLGMVKDVGFPVVVTLYLLHRIEGKLDQLNRSIQALPRHCYNGQNQIIDKSKTKVR